MIRSIKVREADPTGGVTRWIPVEELVAPIVILDFEQDFSEASSWVVNHNLGRKPIVTLLTQGGVEMIAEVVHTNVNQLVAYFASPTAGRVRCL